MPATPLPKGHLSMPIQSSVNLTKIEDFIDKTMGCTFSMDLTNRTGNIPTILDYAQGVEANLALTLSPFKSVARANIRSSAYTTEISRIQTRADVFADLPIQAVIVDIEHWYPRKLDDERDIVYITEEIRRICVERWPDVSMIYYAYGAVDVNQGEPSGYSTNLLWPKGLITDYHCCQLYYLTEWELCRKLWGDSYNYMMQTEPEKQLVPFISLAGSYARKVHSGPPLKSTWDFIDGHTDPNYAWTAGLEINNVAIQDEPRFTNMSAKAPFVILYPEPYHVINASTAVWEADWDAYYKGAFYQDPGLNA